jgi:hypothetical protein
MVSCRLLSKKARKQIQQLKRPLIGSPEEFTTRYKNDPSIYIMIKATSQSNNI